MKVCPRCKKEKPNSDFGTRTQKGKQYLMSPCKSCNNLAIAARYRIKKVSLKLRNAMFRLLGSFCKRCGFSDKRALQVDHVHNNGYEERKRYRGQNMYRHILSVGGKGYQILCANCNWIKRHNHMKRLFKQNIK